MREGQIAIVADQVVAFGNHVVFAIAVGADIRAMGRGILREECVGKIDGLSGVDSATLDSSRVLRYRAIEELK